MLDPHPLFPGTALIPFGGLGSLGEGLMSSGVLGPSLGSAGSKLLYFYQKIFLFMIAFIPILEIYLRLIKNILGTEVYSYFDGFMNQYVGIE